MNLSRVAAHGVRYTLALGIQRGLPILLLPILAREVSVTELGEVALALTIASVLSLAFGLGFPVAISRLFHDEDDHGEPAHWAMLIRVQLGAAAALAAIVWLTGPLWGQLFDEVSWSDVLKAAVILGFARAMQGTTAVVLRASERSTAFLVVAAVEVVVGGVGAIVGVRSHGPPGFIAGLALGALAASAAAAGLGYRRPAWSGAHLRASSRFALPFMAHALAGWILSLSDRVVIERLADLQALAAYHVAYALGSVPILLTDAAQAALLPGYYRSDDPDKAARYRRILPTSIAAVGAISVLIVAASPALTGFMAPGLGVPVMVVAFIAAIPLVRIPYHLAFATLSDRKQSGQIAQSTAIAAVVNVALNVALVGTFGIEGAAFATLVSYGLMSALAWRYASRVTDEQSPQLVPPSTSSGHTYPAGVDGAPAAPHRSTD